MPILDITLDTGCSEFARPIDHLQRAVDYAINKINTEEEIQKNMEIIQNISVIKNYSVPPYARELYFRWFQTAKR